MKTSQAAAAFVVLFLAVDARAYTIYTFNGLNIKRKDDAGVDVQFTRLYKSIPKLKGDGSIDARWSAYRRAIFRWNDVVGAVDELKPARKSGASYVTLANTKDEVGTAADQFSLWLEGAAGITLPMGEPGGPNTGGVVITESDTIVARSFGRIVVDSYAPLAFHFEMNEVGFSEDYPLDEGGIDHRGDKVFLHEFGHAQGLGHEAGFATMQDGTERSNGGKGPIDLSLPRMVAYPDDHMGLRVLYPNVGTWINHNAVSYTHYRDNGGSRPLVNAIGNLSVCPGVFLPIRYHIGQEGSQGIGDANRKVRVQPYLNDGNGHRYKMSGAPVSAPADGKTIFGTIASTINQLDADQVTSGWYYLEVKVVLMNGGAEYNLWDNFAIQGPTVEVWSACP